MWTTLASEATTKPEHLSFIRALYQLAPDDWVVAILKQYIDTSEDDSIVLMAERAHDSMKDRIRLQEESATPDAEDED